MSHKSIIVHMDASRRCAERLALARTIARRQDAGMLVALLALTPRLVPPLPTIPAVPMEPPLAGVDPEQRRIARAVFDEVMAEGDFGMTWEELDAGPPARGMARAALYADLLVLGQHDPGDPMQRDVPRDFIQSVLLESGKPCLVVPSVGEFSDVGNKVVVAWKPTPECARAVAAAVSLMQNASAVHVAAWGPETIAPVERSFGILRYLRAHGIEATVERSEQVPQRPGQLLLSLAAARSSDLLVMGCYGHSRARELLLGGVTRTVLTSMTLPVLMSH